MYKFIYTILILNILIKFGNSNPTLLDLFHQKVYQNLILDALPTRDYFISFTDKGIPVTENDFNFVGDNQIKQYEKFSNLVDQVPNTKGFYNTDSTSTTSSTSTSTNNQLSNIFLNILNEASFNYSRSMTVDEEENLQAIYHFLKTEFSNGTIVDSDLSIKCFKYRNVMDIMSSNYLSMTTFLRSPDATEQDRKNFNGRLYNDIISYNEKRYITWCSDYNGYMEYIKKYTQYSSPDYIEFMKKSMTGSTTQGSSSFYPSQYYPQIYFTFDFGGIDLFIDFVFNSTNDLNYPQVNPRDIGGNSNLEWEFNLNYNGGSEQTETKVLPIDTEGLEINFQVTTLPITRSWFDENLLTSNQWVLNDQGYISDGDLYGDMPIYITGLIIAKNITITLNSHSIINQDSIIEINNSVNAFFGPLFIKGSIDNISANETNPIILNNVINYPGMQIIGFVCKKLPLTPNYENDPQPTMEPIGPTSTSSSSSEQIPSPTPSPSNTPSTNNLHSGSSKIIVSSSLLSIILLITLLL